MINLVWITPDAEKLLARIARVSNPINQSNDNIKGLIEYMVKHKHWSPFEMVNACIEINTTRDIGRQILRHRSFVFQEFSQRYADVNSLPPMDYRETRLQDTKNRQSSLITNNTTLIEEWSKLQFEVDQVSRINYKKALELGIAKEQARALLPEGLTPTRMYMAGTIRSWMHYCQLRMGPETQKEHQEIAKAIFGVLINEMPITFGILQSTDV